jgi:hypothetical protein
MKNLTLIQDFRKKYIKSFLDLPGLITERYAQFNSEAQKAEELKAKEKMFAEYKQKISNIKNIALSDRKKAVTNYYGLKYPKRSSDLSSFREIGMRQKSDALLFSTIASDSNMLEEIRQAFELNDIDYASGLIDAYRAKQDLYTQEELESLTQEEVSENMDKVNRSQKYLKNCKAFPMLNQLDEIELEKFPKLTEYKTELHDADIEVSILNEFENQVNSSYEYLRSAELFPYLTEAERLEAFNNSSLNPIGEEKFRIRATKLWKKSNPNA